MEMGIKHKLRDAVPFVVMLALSAALFVIVASGKRIQFCDEMFSYTITNSDSPLYQLSENKWYTNEEFADKLTHTENDSLRQTLAMVKQDFVHPPLYYICFYISSVISGKDFSKWTGLAVNFLFFMGTQVLIWLIVRKIFQSPFTAFIACMIYALNKSTLSNACLVRMYMMMTFFLAAFVYINMLIIDRDGKEKRLYIWLGVVTATGFMTQYYFALFAILFFVVEAVSGCINRKYKRIMMYLGSMVMAVILATFVWDFWMEAILKRFITTSMTGRSLNLFSNIPLMLDGLVIMQMSVFQWGYKAAEWVVPIIIIVFLLHPQKDDKYPGLKELVVKMTVAAVFYAGCVRYISPLNSTRYYYPADMLEILVVIVCAVYLASLACNRLVNILVCTVLLVGNILLMVNGFGIDYYGEGPQYDAQRNILSLYGKIPYIVVGGESIEVSGSLQNFLMASDIIRITENYEADGSEVLGEAKQFIIVCQGDENGNSEIADYGLYYYIMSTGNFAGRDFLLRSNGLNYYIAHRK